MPRVIFHADMDAFFASVEQRDFPEYRGKPLIVGAPPDRRGVVCAASYEARKFKVHSAMPSRTAARLCPQGIFVPPRMEAYRAESLKIMEIFRDAADVLEKVSVDEAYLDLSSHCAPGAEADEALFAAIPIAKRLKERVLEERALTVSIGVAANKFLAKLASDFQKPNGLTLIPERDKAAFLRPMLASAIHGVGPVTARELAEAGIVTMGDIQDRRDSLRALTGSFAEKLAERAFGNDDRPVDGTEDRKSISSETTFDTDTEERGELRKALREMAEDVAQTLTQYSLGALTIQVKVRYSDFTTLTRQYRVADPVSTAPEIYRLACHLLARDKLVKSPLRLLGVGVSTLVAPQSEQLQLGL